MSASTFDTSGLTVARNCVIIACRVKHPTAAGETLRTTVSMHVERFARMCAYLGEGVSLERAKARVLRVVKTLARETQRTPGDNVSQLVWQRLDAEKEAVRDRFLTGEWQA